MKTKNNLLIKKRLDDIKIIRRRLDESEAIIKAGESPFQHLSGIRFDIRKIMESYSDLLWKEVS
jgi:hypothetical protein